MTFFLSVNVFIYTPSFYKPIIMNIIFCASESLQEYLWPADDEPPRRLDVIHRLLVQEFSGNDRQDDLLHDLLLQRLESDVLRMLQ